MKICVIGAGFSGLVAAERLTTAGHEVVVLEARERVGGRVWSQQLSNGSWIERGAEFIEHHQTALVDLAMRLNVPLAPAGMSYSAREPRGGAPMTLQEFYSGAAALRKTLEKPHRAHSVREALDATPISQGMRDALAARFQISFAQSVDALDVGVLGSGALAAFDDSEALRCEHGNQQIAVELARRLGGRVHLDSAVLSIEWSDESVLIRTASGELMADGCVITVPASVWRRIDFSPALPDWKAAALDGVEYGHAAKLAFELPRSHRPRATLSVPDFYWTWTATRGRDTADPVLNCFAGSSTALTMLAVTEGAETWFKHVSELHPELELDPDHALLSTWDEDPWIRAAYSTRTPTHRPDVEALRKPVGPLHFAGEHTEPVYFAMMDGAVRTGLRVAAEFDRVQHDS